MIVVKKDFVLEYTKSYHYGKKLTSGKAYYLKDDNGNTYYASKYYIDKYLNVDLSKIPDLTTSLISMTTNENSINKTHTGNDNKFNHDKSNAITYIILRQEKLIEYNLSSYEPLKKYYDKYISDGNLNDKDINHIINIEKRAKQRNTKLSLYNLRTCYAYEFILKRTLNYLEQNQKTNGVKFITSLISYLRKNYTLSENQIKGLENWLDYLPKDLRETKLMNFKN
ncbi:MAG: hypothetical protein SPI03_02865 [Campylobacter sputorum]|uniref:hypothetical protein n=1 Tax=Campylobacter sputorum TaxID=206 RepID=UPI000B78C264|nr:MULTISPECIES: hypothetical protein [Campylobacter]ASM38964.1 hypothetical protein CSPARA_1421 [Campylobacter sputorum bv. paraureolyticus LMG 11764]MBF6677299.1 hypothetical protein [Campylobacter sp. RM11259]MDY6120267.1 hypothetical protein [Campylobacter sputorum]